MYGIVDPDIVVLNYFYQVVPGELTIVTGVPNSGKSEWIDALLCNLNEIAGWKFALCSMENKVRLFIDDFKIMFLFTKKCLHLLFATGTRIIPFFP